MDLRERSASPERRHPWEQVRADFFLTLLGGIRDSIGARSWLDVGSGDAWLAQRLRRGVGATDRIVCWDINYTSEMELHDDDGLDYTAEQPEGPFDVVLMLDVVEHVANDRTFVRHIADSLLAPGGRVIISVPAYMSLFTEHDRYLHHFRRYSPRDGRRLLSDIGLHIELQGGLFQSLLPLRALQAVVERLAGRATHAVGVGSWKRGPVVTGMIKGVLTADARVSLAASKRGVTLPGLSYWAVCRRPA
jgi:hypothetical protein